MNWKALIINIIVLSALTVYEAVLGGNQPINYVWFISFVVLSAIFQYIFALYENTKQDKENLQSEVEELNKQLGLQILQGKREGNNFFELAIYPSLYGNDLRINNTYAFHICVNSVYSISKVPDILITTNKKWKIFDKHNSEINPFEHNEKYLFTIKNCKVTSISNKYFVYDLNVEFLETGENEFSILSESRDLRSEITNTIDVSN